MSFNAFFIFEIILILLFFKIIFILFTYSTPPSPSQSKLNIIVFHHYLLLFNCFSPIRGYWFIYFNISLFYYGKQAVMQHIAAREVPTYFEVCTWHSVLSPNTDYYIFDFFLWFYLMAVYYNNCIWFLFWLLNF